MEESSFVVGARVQAIDQNGHWEPGVVMKVTERGYVVSWPGWDEEYDLEVEGADCREPCLPAEERSRREYKSLPNSTI